MFEDGGIITGEFYARFDASFVFDPSVIPADAVCKKSLHTRRWAVADGPCGKMMFFVIYLDDRACGAGVYTKMPGNVAHEVCAYARRVLALPDTIAFEEKWTAYTLHHGVVDPPIWIKGFHSNTPVRGSICGNVSCINTPAYSDLQYVAAAIMHRESFAPIGKRFFGMDSDELRRISQCAIENTTFQWHMYADSESDEYTPRTDGWPMIHDSVL